MPFRRGRSAPRRVRLISSRSCSFSKRYTTRKSPSRVPAVARDFERSAAVRRVVKGSHVVAAGSRSQPKSRPTKRRMFRSARTTSEGVSRHAIAVRKNSSRVMPERVRVADVGKQIKEGRHVGLDFYDLLVEALMFGLSPQAQNT